jgi:hypothetical protein
MKTSAPFERVLECPGIRLRRHFLLEFVHVVGASFVDDTGGVAHDDILFPDSQGDVEFRAGDAGSPAPLNTIFTS